MRIAYITSGAAGMYCGSCMNANTLATALIARGHDVALTPTYTPMRTDEAVVSIDHVFFGAINVYLQQKLALFRHTPRFVDWLLDRPKLLDWVGKLGSSTDARLLGSLTLSMLQGEHGRQRKELEKLVAWLKNDFRPDLVHLSFVMFLGFAHRLRAELGVPVVCSLQGDDIFLEELEEPYRGQAHALIRAHQSDVAAFIAPCHAYANAMSELMGLERSKIHVARLGIRTRDFADSQTAEARREHAEGPFVIGFLARLCREKGLHQLIDAFQLLTRQLGPERLRLRIAGYLGERDRAYVELLREKIQGWGLGSQVDWVGEVDRKGKVDFLRGLDVFSMPTVYREPKGLSVLEAMASGVPVVQPRHGTFPEMLEATGGGLLVEPGSPEALAAALRQLHDDPELRHRLGEQGRAAVHRDFTAEAEAEGVLAVYELAKAGYGDV